MRTGPYEIRRRLCRIDKEEAIGKLVTLDSGFSARDAQAPDVLRLVSAHGNEPYEVRVRVTGRTENLREAVRVGNEVETLYTNGPAGGGGAWKSARDVVAVASVLLPRELAKPHVRFVEA